MSFNFEQPINKTESAVDKNKPVKKELEGSHFGINEVLELDGKIISLRGPEKALYIGMEVEVVGDSHGFVNGGLEPGEKVTIIDFNNPSEDTMCVEVSHEKGTALLKVKEIK